MNTNLQIRRAATVTALLITGGLLMSTSEPAHGEVAAATESPAEKDRPNRKLQKATFGSGCFWCTEAFFSELKGVKSAVSGYSGGKTENPSYKAVCTGLTGHAEVIQVTYDPAVISYPELLEVFWKTHDPTTLNRQGADVGTQYRSAIFYHTDEQREQADHFKKKLEESGAFPRPIVTEITKFDKFYPAEDDHQEYYAENPEAGYCQVVIRPKLEKFRKVFADKLKDGKEKETKK
jgi:peptide-methionine (S)-S-oxide reductase